MELATVIKEFDEIRLLVDLETTDSLDTSIKVSLPAGSEGTVVDLLGGWGGFECDFLIGDPEGDDYEFVTVTVRNDQCEPFSS
jgi:hypothetical protein